MREQWINVYSTGWYFLRTHYFCNMRTAPEETAERLQRIYARRKGQGVNTKAFTRSKA